MAKTMRTGKTKKIGRMKENGKTRKDGKTKKVMEMKKTGFVEDSGKIQRRSSNTDSLKEPGNAGSTARKRCSLSTATGENYRMVAKNGREILTCQKASLIASTFMSRTCQTTSQILRHRYKTLIGVSRTHLRSRFHFKLTSSILNCTQKTAGSSTWSSRQTMVTLNQVGTLR